MRLKLSRKFQFNQFIVTGLAVMIAVAGYMTYEDGKKQKKDTPVDGQLLSEQNAEKLYAGDSQLTGTGDIPSQDEDEPGAALFVNSGSDIITFAANAKLTREQTRAKSKEALLEVMENESLEEDSKTRAANAMVTLSENIEKENAAETTLAAKGFANAVVTISDEAVDVVLDMTNVDDAGRAQIEEVVKTKTGIGVEHITITPIRVEDE